jgi:hypothetical protein
MFGAKMSHMQTQIHKIHHGSNLGEATTFPFIVLPIWLPTFLLAIIYIRSIQMGHACPL